MMPNEYAWEFTYTPLHINVEIKNIERFGDDFEKVDENCTYRNINIGKIPIMLNQSSVF